MQRSILPLAFLKYAYYVREMDTIGSLISDVSRLLRRRFDERARLIGVTRAQWRTLFMLKRHEGINQGGLADLLEVEPITLCRMIDRLEEAGHVERRRDPSDRRAWRIHLTDQARPLIENLGEIAEGLTHDALFGLDAAQLAALADGLSTIRSNLNAIPEQEKANNG